MKTQNPRTFPGPNQIFQGLKGMVNCQNLRDKGPPECNSAPG